MLMPSNFNAPVTAIVIKPMPNIRPISVLPRYFLLFIGGYTVADALITNLRKFVFVS